MSGLFSERLPFWREDHILLRDEIRAFIERDIRPLWQSPINGSRVMEARRMAAEANLSGIDLSEEIGGRSLDLVSQGIAYEECGQLDIDAREIIGSGHARMIDIYGSVAAKARWMPGLIKGESIVGIGITEETAGSDIRALKTIATPSEGGYILSGKKFHISRIEEASAFILLSKVVGRPDHELTAFIVDMAQDGITRVLVEPLGLRGWSYGDVHFDQVHVPMENVLGQIGDGFSIFESHFSYWRILVALLCIGAAQQSVLEGIDYAKGRVAFGQTLPNIPPVMFQLSDAATQLYAARLLCYHGLWLADQKEPFMCESAMSKLLGTSTAFDAVDAVMSVMGARGYTLDYAHEKRLRDIRGLRIADGTNEVMKSVVGRELFGKSYYNQVVRPSAKGD